MLTDFAQVVKAVPALDFGFKLYETVMYVYTVHQLLSTVPKTIWKTIPSKIPSLKVVNVGEKILLR